ncbi:MAG: sigma-70 family RNA polymerase sigma factor [Myxococcales bacterium]|nr:sigma-70 family RNA polymerase sigma factor [Myxococcales bacterium]
MTPHQRQRIHDAMARLADGHRDAFDEVVRDLWPVVRDFAIRGVGQVADADDVAQEVFVRICTRISDFDPTRDGVAWALGIARYEVMTHRRKRLRRREVPEPQGHPDHGAGRPADPEEEEALIHRDLLAALTDVLGRLDGADLVALGVADSVDGATAAAPTASARRKRKQRATARLRQLWRSIHGSP